MKGEAYKILRKQVRNATDNATLSRLEAAAERLYNAGKLTVQEYGKIDVYIMERIAKMED